VRFFWATLYISVKNTPLTPLGQWGQTTSETAPFLCGTWTPSNTSVPGPTPLTVPNDSPIGSRTSAQHVQQIPHWLQWEFGSRTPQVHPQNCPFLRRSPPPSNRLHPSLDLPYSPPLTASGSNMPFVHRSPTGQTDRPTDGLGEWSVRIPRTFAILIESDALIITDRNHAAVKSHY